MIDIELKDYIREKYGEETIQEARERLCRRCARYYSCSFLPITSDGKDCPYFQRAKKQAEEETDGNV